MDFFRDLKYNFQRQGILTKIIVINASVFLTVNIIGNLSHLQLLPYLALPIGGDTFLFRFWTLFTYMFTHADFWHLFWNMMLFYFMSQIFFTIMGQKKMLYVYVMSGVSGGALMLILGLIFPHAFGYSILLGASAAVLGVGAVMAMYSPDFRVYLFGAFEVKYKFFYLGVFVVSTVIDFSINTGGKISHIGGALFGVAYGYYLKRGTDLFDLNFRMGKRTRLKIVSNSVKNQTYDSSQSISDSQKMDELLDKISRSGYDSLTKKEKEELFRLSQKNK